MLIAMAAIGAITGGTTGNSYVPPAGTYGYSAPTTGGTPTPSYDPGDGGGHYVGGPAWTPGPPIPAYKPPTPTAAPATPKTPPTVNWGLIGLGAAITTLGALAFIGYRMTPQPITTQHRNRNIHPCCGVTIGQPHATSCRQHPPENPAQWSNRR